MEKKLTEFWRERNRFTGSRKNTLTFWKEFLNQCIGSLMCKTSELDQWREKVWRKTSNKGIILLSMEFSTYYNFPNPLLNTPSLKGLSHPRKAFLEVIETVANQKLTLLNTDTLEKTKPNTSEKMKS